MQRKMCIEVAVTYFGIIFRTIREDYETISVQFLRHWLHTTGVYTIVSATVRLQKTCHKTGWSAEKLQYLERNIMRHWLNTRQGLLS